MSTNMGTTTDAFIIDGHGGAMFLCELRHAHIPPPLAVADRDGIVRVAGGESSSRCVERSRPARDIALRTGDRVGGVPADVVRGGGRARRPAHAGTGGAGARSGVA